MVNSNADKFERRKRIIKKANSVIGRLVLLVLAIQAQNLSGRPPADSDTILPGLVPGFGLHRELKELGEVGLTPYVYREGKVC